MFCTSCGAKNTADANYCKQCGRKMERNGPPRLSEEEFALPVTAEEKAQRLLAAAYDRHASGDLDMAVKACAEALSLAPESTDAHSLMSTLYEKQGHLELAILEREKVLELNPGSIADREKLDQLRNGANAVPARRVTSSRRLPAATLFESPAGAAVAGVLVMIIVLLIGGWMVWAHGSKNRERASASTNASQVMPAPNAQGQPEYGMASQQNGAYSAMPPYTNYPAAYPPNGNGGYISYNNPPAEPQRPRSEIDTSAMRAQPRTVLPAPVLTAAIPPMERDPRFDEAARPVPENTVHLPDANPAPAPAATAPPRNPGKIEIVVSPNGANSNSSAPAVSASPGGASMDSRQQYAVALQANLRGDYRTAVRAYIKALDGAGDDSGLIQQQIGLCYQRLGDKDSAVAHYNEAVTAYKAQLSAGRNVESARSGIRTAEAGIRACQ